MTERRARDAGRVLARALSRQARPQGGEARGARGLPRARRTIVRCRSTVCSRRARLHEAGQDEPIGAAGQEDVAGVAPAHADARSGGRARRGAARRRHERRGGRGASSATKRTSSSARAERRRAGWLLELYRRAERLSPRLPLRRVARRRRARGRSPRDDGARVFWEAAYPRAYAELVETLRPGGRQPRRLLYAIMRKESGFNPLDVSYADARGLLQMIPPTSAHVAEKTREPFFPDELYDPEINVRLGAIYIGALYRKFGGRGAAGGGRLQRRPARDGPLVRRSTRATRPTSSSSWSPSRRRASTSSASPASTPTIAFSTGRSRTRFR